MFELKDYSAAPGASIAERNNNLHAAVTTSLGHKKIVAHCTGGTGRTGYFLAAMMMMELFT